MISKILRDHLKRSEKSLNEISKEARVDYASLHRFVNQRSRIQIETVQKLCKYFGLELTYCESRHVAVLTKIAGLLIVKSPREFKHRNGRINEEALNRHLNVNAIPSDGLDRNEKAVVSVFNGLEPDRKSKLLSKALNSLKFSTEMNRLCGKRLGELDQDISEFRDVYSQLDAEGKRMLRNALIPMARSFEHELNGSHDIDFRVTVSSRCYDTEENEDGRSRTTLRPSLMLQAMDAWDKGNNFTPKATLGNLS